jgi:hypothetical protein
METSWKVGRGFALVGVLYILLGGAVMVGFGAPVDPPLGALVSLARTDLQDRLDVRAEAITLESAEPMSFPCPAPDDCQGRLPGYVIRLRVDDVVYEYNAKGSEQLAIVWHEVADASAR